MDYGSFLEVKANKRIIHHRNPSMMSRTLLEDVPDSEPVESYNIQTYMDKIREKTVVATKWEL